MQVITKEFISRYLDGEIVEIFDLKPTTSQKSFYGKAQVILDSFGNTVLFSYGTAILKKTAEGKIYRIWESWSATTGKHIRSFCALNKAEYFALPSISARENWEKLKKNSEVEVA